VNQPETTQPYTTFRGRSQSFGHRLIGTHDPVLIVNYRNHIWDAVERTLPVTLRPLQLFLSLFAFRHIFDQTPGLAFPYQNANVIPHDINDVATSALL
jgi:hypothetical protein